MKRIGRWRLVTLAAVVVFMGVAATALAQVSQVHLGWSENNVYETMTVMWYSPADASQIVYYGTAPGYSPADYAYSVEGLPKIIAPTEDWTQTTQFDPLLTSFDGYYYTAVLENLLHGQTYSFRIHDEYTDTLTDEWSFRTIADDETIEFAFAGDSQRPHEISGVDFAQLISRPAAPANWPYMRNFITRKAANLEPDFFLALGDFVARGNNQEQWHNWFDAWQEYAVTDSGRMIPIVPVVGNHDMGGYPSLHSSYEWFLGLFAVPQPAQGPPGVPCYSLDFPNLHLTVLAATSGQIQENSPLAEIEADSQTSWLATDLSSQEAEDAAWRFVAFHYNYLGCFDACTPNDYPSDRYMRMWTELLQGYGVDTVFMGHTHNYTRSWPVWLDTPHPCAGGSLGYTLLPDTEEGVTYITHGGWGGVPNLIRYWPGSNLGCQLRGWIAAAASHPSLGYAKVDAAGCEFVIEDTAGNPIDSFALPYAPNYNQGPTYTEMVP